MSSAAQSFYRPAGSSAAFPKLRVSRADRSVSLGSAIRAVHPSSGEGVQPPWRSSWLDLRRLGKEIERGKELLD
jgi:hypothetical protein